MSVERQLDPQLQEHSAKTRQHHEVGERVLGGLGLRQGIAFRFRMGHEGMLALWSKSSLSLNRA